MNARENKLVSADLHIFSCVNLSKNQLALCSGSKMNYLMCTVQLKNIYGINNIKCSEIHLWPINSILLVFKLYLPAVFTHLHSVSLYRSIPLILRRPLGHR